MNKRRVILDSTRFRLTIDRLCHQLIETYQDFSNTCIVGIQPRGVILADRIVDRLSKLGVKDLKYGKLDITFYRDDFRKREKPLAASSNEIDFLVENQRVVLIDDVLYTGRTVQAALAALQQYGRPTNVSLLSLIDRQFNRHLPIQADYIGMRVDALDEAYVKVEWDDDPNKNRILLFKEKED